ncbi:lipase 3-like [Aricia agestis]|uniref:lipase 3-like n=1 Tax=Aricia agestis TaxID=91739 RepID=UPI001C20854C|nr:lipase 3-like [Aricia agestis]
MIFNLVLIVIASLHRADGQFSFRQLTNSLIENPVVQLVTHASGEAFATTLNTVSAIPNAIASSLGIYHVPTISNTYNTVDIPGGFIEEYNSGLSNEDAKLSIDELLIKYGFPVEVHRVESEDGYILAMYRIPGNGSAVFLMHGLLGSSDDYVVSGPESGLAYLLAREGYDVWMGNARGNKHSRLHRTLRASQKEFWDFSWHEIGVYDLPVMIDHVLIVRSDRKLKYVGHSQGTTSFFVMASERPEYNDKIAVMAALSPVVYMSHLKSPVLRLLAPSSPIISSALNIIGAHEFLPNNLLMRNVKKLLCHGTVAELLCFNVVFLIVGYDLPQLNASNIPVFFGHTPSGASTKQLVHYSQEITSGEFEKFDYGYHGNEQIYGTKEPPKYDLSRVTVPVALFYSDADWLASPRDVERLSRELPNVIEMYKVPFDNFNHLDFILAKDFKTLIFNRLLYILNEY